MQLLLALLLVLSFWIPTASADLVFPEPSGYVNDFADILSVETETAIEQLANTIREETSSEIAVVTIESLEGYDPNEYAVELGRAWGVGTAERDDGVVFLTSVGDRETYIATGYGVEAYITDAQAFWITDAVVVPYFKQGDFDTGILSGVEQIKAALVDLEALPEGYSSSLNAEDIGDEISIVFWLLYAFFFVFPWFIGVLGRSKRWWPGGLIGGGIGFLIAAIISVSLLLAIPFAIFGFIVDYFASSNYKKGKNSFWTGGGSSGWGGGSSGGWGGGSSGGSSGGFSGGSFGGGGGGSSW